MIINILRANRAFFGLLFFALSPYISARYLTAKVTMVVDCNTLDLLIDNEVKRVIFSEVDCPEIGQPYADEAKTYLTKKVLEVSTIVLTKE